jgi:hypothetical protein
VSSAGQPSVPEPAAPEADPTQSNRPVTEPPVTGDAAVDDALGRLHESAVAGDLDAQVAAGEAVHRALQDRLSDLGGG